MKVERGWCLREQSARDETRKSFFAAGPVAVGVLSTVIARLGLTLLIELLVIYGRSILHLQSKIVQRGLITQTDFINNAIFSVDNDCGILPKKA